jgi:DNA invertase Pin-like site-specific DNA recombinase
VTTLGYARASTQDQNLYSQTDALTAAGQRDSSPDKITGKNASRPGITACIDYLPAGHVLLVHSTDRLGRSMTDILTIEGELHSRSI